MRCIMTGSPYVKPPYDRGDYVWTRGEGGTPPPHPSPPYFLTNNPRTYVICI